MKTKTIINNALVLAVCLILLLVAGLAGCDRLTSSYSRQAVEEKYPGANIVNMPNKKYTFMVATNCQVRIVECYGNGISSDALFLIMPECN